ncbi:hypothetical protein K3495_g8362 [Podosphaera aphanis]|nr:hypothetical protein K3495_g8362 [Podosphaera aphanis]
MEASNGMMLNPGSLTKFTGQNLYIGTSASEILHFVQIPSDIGDPIGLPSYILASRLPPAFHEPNTLSRPGIQQILLLPTVNKACILCNWTVTFYSLPELSPVFGTTQIRPCNWIGGINLNTDPKQILEDGKPPSVTVLASLSKKIRIIKISETPRGLKTIDFARCLNFVRRDSFACVADAKSYALLDVDRLLKIPLFSISSLQNSRPTSANSKLVEDHSAETATQSQEITSSAQVGSSGPSNNQESRKSVNLDNVAPKNLENVPRDNPSPSIEAQYRPGQTEGHNPKNLASESLVVTKQDALSAAAIPGQVFLKPHILSPTPQEFLLVTGTGANDPGVGMFVNLEGDPTRSTIEFERYPNDIVVDGRGIGVEPISTTIDDDEEGFVLASMDLDNGDKSHGIEIQRWDLDPGERENERHWLELPIKPIRRREPSKIGLRSVLDSEEFYFNDLIQNMMLKRFQLAKSKQILDTPDSSSPDEKRLKAQSQQNLSDQIEEIKEQKFEEEHRFIKRLASVRTRIIVWSGNNMWWAVRNPPVLRLDAIISQFTASITKNVFLQPPLIRQHLIDKVNTFCRREAKNEAEYLSLEYIKQRAGLSLLLDGLLAIADPLSENEYRIVEDFLVSGSLDPRVILAIIPYLRDEIFENEPGIWIQGGILTIVHQFIVNSISDNSYMSSENLDSYHTLHFLRRYLTAWRKKKGFGSIPNENEIFKSVDAALLVVLLRLDRLTASNPQESRTVRGELYEIVDHGVDCFDRATTILELHHRLYVLSRLYQSRKMAEKVLATWRRILESDLDEGGEFVQGDQKVQEYLLKIRNVSLIEEYGVWLAARSPKLGVKVFAEDRSHVQFEPQKVVDILRLGAPGAVKDYLEYLVFRKSHSEYVNELIVYYLDIVIHTLEESDDIKALLAQSYESYRALRPPKPTYRRFLAENMIDEEWWHSRLRLLQLLGGSLDLKSSYDVESIILRINPFTEYLVPEVIILDGRQAHHDKALKGLTHGLGDYDTAINYCLQGGSSIYHPISGTMSSEQLPTREQQALLFGILLSEFLQIDDVSSRVEQTSNLLDRFGSWFDVQHVLTLIPDTWSVDILSRFLLNSLRRMVRERGETKITKALSGAENLKISFELNENIMAAGKSVQDQVDSTQ